MKEIKKQTFYQVDTRYFKDNTGNGVGDINGLIGKLDYFNFLGVDAVILENILALNDDDEQVQDYKKISSDLGTAKELQNLVEILLKHNIDLYIQMPIGGIKESNEWFKNIEKEDKNELDGMIKFENSIAEPHITTGQFKYSPAKKSYYEFNSKTQEIPLNWSENIVTEKFSEVVKYWNGLGVKGFVFTGFEYIMDETRRDPMNEETLKELRKFYNTINRVNDKIKIIGKSELIFDENFSSGPNKVFDYILSDAMTLIGTHKKLGKDLIGKFSARELAKKLNSYADRPENIVAFGSSNIGRVNSRWGDEGQYAMETAKIIALLLFLNKGSTSIYRGDEIGSLNIGLTRLDDFQDSLLMLRKEKALKNGVKNEKFMDAQILQNAINARALMAWDDTKNGGFSISERTITPISESYKEINVMNQFSDQSSPLIFYKELIKMMDNPKYRRIIENGKCSISSPKGGVVKIYFKTELEKLKIFVNISNKVKKISKTNNGSIVLSSSYHKIYHEMPYALDAYEGIVIYKHKDKTVKEPRMLKLHDENTKVEKNINSPKPKTDKQKAKTTTKTLKVEDEISENAKILREEQRKFAALEIDDSEKTTLTEEEIATTTQIDTDNIEDFDAFIKSTGKPKK